MAKGVKTMKTTEKTEDQNLLKQHVLGIVEGLENGVTYDHCGMDHEDYNADKDDTINGFDYVSDVLDIEYTISSEGEYLGARLLVAFGGPNIWIDTRRQIVEGAWWGDHHVERYHTDAMDIDYACNELFSCR